jgi:hypothetical protein
MDSLLTFRLRASLVNSAGGSGVPQARISRIWVALLVLTLLVVLRTVNAAPIFPEVKAVLGFRWSLTVGVHSRDVGQESPDFRAIRS